MSGFSGSFAIEVFPFPLWSEGGTGTFSLEKISERVV
jgi:hypothetical protein